MLKNLIDSINVHTVSVLLCVQHIALQTVTSQNPQGHRGCEHLKLVRKPPKGWGTRTRRHLFR